MKRRISLHITGRVQGVFFRHGARSEAQRLGILGWVRNEADGSVRIAAEGEERNLREFAKWCKTGTERSRVENIEEEWQDATGEFENFEIL